MGTPARRPLKSRGSKWANWAAHRLAKAGVRPNLISILSVLFAALAAVCLLRSNQAGVLPRGMLLLGAAAAIQMRLLSNLLDGMVAVEGGRKTKSGEVFNDFPDRVADTLIFVAAGYAIPAFSWGGELGWAAALLAVMTAYVRLLGGACGLPQNFIGPMAKQHRMAVMTLACLAAAFEPMVGWSGETLAASLAVIVLGALVTIARRTRRIVRELEAR